MRLAKGASSASGRSAHWPVKGVTGLVMVRLGRCGWGGGGGKKAGSDPIAMAACAGQTGWRVWPILSTSVRRVRKVKVLGILFGDLHHREDGPYWQLVALEARLGGELDRFVDELRRERHI